MASLTELMQFAEYKNRVKNPLPGLIEGVVSNFIAGKQARVAKDKELKLEEQKQKTYELDTALKLLDIKEKTLKIQKENQDAEIQRNFAKAFGVLPFAQGEADNVRGNTFQKLGAETPQKNTAQGKLGQIFNSENLKNYDVVPGFSSKGGFSWSMKNKKDNGKKPLTDAQGVTFREKIKNYAKELAFSEMSEKMGKTWNANLYGPLTPERVAPYVTQDSIMKYMRPAELYLSGKTKQYDTEVKKTRKAVQSQREPLDDLEFD